MPESIRSTSVAVAISGFGLLMNRSALMTRHLPAPVDWDDLTDPVIRGAADEQSVAFGYQPSDGGVAAATKGWIKDGKRC